MNRACFIVHTIALSAQGIREATGQRLIEAQIRPYALLRVDNLLYQVKSGDYIGQNYGKITSISETEVGLREIVQDAAGEWIERASALQLQESAR